MWCWHRIRETESGLCPACRTPYGDDPHEFSAVDMEEVVRANKEKAAAEKKERDRLRAVREQEKREQIVTTTAHHHAASAGHHSHNAAISSANYPGLGAAQPAAGAAASAVSSAPSSSGTNFAAALSSGGLGSGPSLGQFDGADLVAALGGPSRGPPEPPKDRSTLASMRVIRRNLVYAVGLPPNVATEENLRRPEYFGQYGKIAKVVVNRNHNPGDPRRSSASAYVTFSHKEDALACILALDGFYHDGRNVRASYGTSKYCSAFIKSVRCNNPDCTYLHHMGEKEDTFTKQEIQAGYVTSGRDVLARQKQIMAQQAAAHFGGVGAKTRVGGGGPSGTGRESKSPIFPPPSFDELPKKPRTAQSALLGRTQLGSRSVASVVVGGAAPTPPPPPAHTTLTPLTGLKTRVGGPAPAASRPTMAAQISATRKPAAIVNPSDLTPGEALALQRRQEEEMARQQRELAAQQQQQAREERQARNSAQSSPSHSSVGSGGEILGGAALPQQHQIGKAGSGGGVIGGPAIGSSGGGMGSPLLGSLGGTVLGEMAPISGGSGLGSIGSGVLGGQPLPLSGAVGGASLSGPSTSSLGSLGGSIIPTSANPTPDNWGAAGSQSNGFGGSGALWSGEQSKPAAVAPIAPPGDVGGMSLFGTSSKSVGGFSNSGGGSSALASMLGIELPTGSGSLRDRSSAPYAAPAGHVGQPAIGAVGSSAGLGGIVGPPRTGIIGKSGVGGTAIGGSYAPGGPTSHSNNDVALLQSLLPGVNITSGNAFRPAAPGPAALAHQHQQPVGVAALNRGSVQWQQGQQVQPGGVGAVAQSQQQDPTGQQGGQNIW